ncbi:MAG: LamG-like jellyroll fold domain-containing protein [Planctomycetota bacterium]
MGSRLLMSSIVLVTVLSPNLSRCETKPVGWWIFDRDHIRQMVPDLAGGNEATMAVSANFTDKPPHALVLDKTSAVMTIGGVDGSQLPKRQLSVQAWIALDAGTTWGGIIGYMQDNGSYEKGWLLGYNKERFYFAVSTKGTLTYLAGTTRFRKGAWYHVVGTYDGAAMKVFVNGKLENNSTEQSGDIDYPPNAYYTIGAYRDDNELYRCEGKLHEVRLYDVALSPEEIAADYKAKEWLTFESLQFNAPPYAQFSSPSSAVIRWKTQTPCSTILELVRGETIEQVVHGDVVESLHEANISGLEAGTVYSYRIKAIGERIRGISPLYELDTTFNYTVDDVSAARSPYSGNSAEQRYAKAAELIIAKTGITKGYCLVYGCDRGQLAFELAKRTEFKIVCVDEDSRRIAETRKLLYEAGIYGRRVTALRVDSLGKVPITSWFANLIVSERMIADGKCSGDAKEVFRLLRPAGGMACFIAPSDSGKKLSIRELKAWLTAVPEDAVRVDASGAMIVRPDLPDADGWTHQYGNSRNTASSLDTLGGATATGDLEVQWIGRPGADFGIDRNPRMPAPLSIKGRIFHQGLNRLIVLDAYNGAILWSAEIPDLRRVNLPQDSSNWCADEDSLFVAVKDKCWVFDAVSGRRTAIRELPHGPRGKTHDWGYIAQAGQFLYGSSVKKGAIYTDFWGHASWYDKPGPGMAKVCSDDIFAVSKRNGSTVWAYANGVVIDTTIAIGDGKVYFVESRSAEVKNSQTGRIGSEHLWSDQYLVALSAKTGDKLWEKKIDVADGTVVFFLAFSGASIIVASSSSGQYRLYCYSGGDGGLNWQVSHKWPSDNHSGHMQHPVVTTDRVYLEPCGYDLKTGSKFRIDLSPFKSAKASHFAGPGQAVCGGDGDE